VNQQQIDGVFKMLSHFPTVPSHKNFTCKSQLVIIYHFAGLITKMETVSKIKEYCSHLPRFYAKLKRMKKLCG